MWTPLEASLAPFKELARLNRQMVTDAAGQSAQMVLKADKCRVEGETSGPSAWVHLGFAVGRDAFSVGLLASDYRRDGAWAFDRIRADISAGLKSGTITPDAACQLVPANAVGRSGL